MTQTEQTAVRYLTAITFYGSKANEPIQALCGLLPDQHDEIDEYVRRSNALLAARHRCERVRATVVEARNALIYVKSRIDLDAVDRLRGSAENPHLDRPLYPLYELVRSMAGPDDVAAVDQFFIAALVSGHARMACREAERLAGESRLALARHLDITS